MLDRGDQRRVGDVQHRLDQRSGTRAGRSRGRRRTGTSWSRCRTARAGRRSGRAPAAPGRPRSSAVSSQCSRASAGERRASPASRRGRAFSHGSSAASRRGRAVTHARQPRPAGTGCPAAVVGIRMRLSRPMDRLVRAATCLPPRMPNAARRCLLGLACGSQAETSSSHGHAVTLACLARSAVTPRGRAHSRPRRWLSAPALPVGARAYHRGHAGIRGAAAPPAAAAAWDGLRARCREGLPVPQPGTRAVPGVPGPGAAGLRALLPV